MPIHFDMERSRCFEYPQPEQWRGGDAVEPPADADRALQLVGDPWVDVDALPHPLEFATIERDGDVLARDSVGEQLRVRADATALRGDIPGCVHVVSMASADRHAALGDDAVGRSPTPPPVEAQSASSHPHNFGTDG
ncbi:hypothetical protein [Agromyces sp. CCNWLW203]|uniref:hypothetical protein n=1 Tax=Agromyces sp. CCNWLW203 TaxID=3112842 RepID=UPI002F9609D8